MSDPGFLKCRSTGFHMPGYHLLFLFNFHRGLAMYIRDAVAYQWQQAVGRYDAEFNCLWVKFKIRAHLLHFGFIYRSQNAGRELSISGFDSLSDSISSILANYPNSEIVVAGDFNVHNSSCLRHSGRTTPVDQYKQLVNTPTHISCVGGHQNKISTFCSLHTLKSM